MEDQLPLLINELSPTESQSIKKKIKDLYNEASKFDSDFSEMTPVSTVIAMAVIKDYVNTELDLKQIAEKNKLELRTIAQVFGDKYMNEGYMYLRQSYPLRIFKEFDLDRPLLLDLAVLLRTLDEPSTVFLCSINGLCISVSQLILSLSFVNIYLVNPGPSSEILSIPFNAVEDQAQLLMLNPGLIVDSMLALEGEEMQKISFLDDMGFVSAVREDLKEIQQRTQNIDNPLQSLHQFDLTLDKMMKFNTTKTVDNLKSNIKDVENSRIKHIYKIATYEQLFEMLYTDVKDNMEVYVAVTKNNEHRYIYGKVLKVHNNNMFEVKLNSAEFDSNKVLKVGRNALAYGKACKEIDFPIGTRVIAYFKPRNRTEQKHFTNQWWAGTIGRDASSDPNLEYLVFFDCDQEAYIPRLFIRLHFDQAIDCTDDNQFRVIPYDNYLKSPTRREFLKKLLTSTRNLHSNNIGTTIAAINNRKVYQANILDIDRDLFLLRYNKTDQTIDNEPGNKGCTDIRCYKHSHFDEWVYRGSTSKLNPPDEKRMKRRNRFGGKGGNTVSEFSSGTGTKVPTARKTTTSLKIDASRSSVFDDDDYDIREKKEKSKKVRLYGALK
jgi:hypothetical protein